VLARGRNDQASGLSAPASAELRRAVAEFGAAQYARHIGVLLNRAVATLNATGASGLRLASSVRLSERTLARIDEATLAVTDVLP
jgi:hypothetical protein